MKKYYIYSETSDITNVLLNFIDMKHYKDKHLEYSSGTLNQIEILNNDKEEIKLSFSTNLQYLTKDIDVLFLTEKELNKNPYTKDFCKKYKIDLVVFKDYAYLLSTIFEVDMDMKFYLLDKYDEIIEIGLNDLDYNDFSFNENTKKYFENKKELLLYNKYNLEKNIKKTECDIEYNMDLLKIHTILKKENIVAIEKIKEVSHG